MGKLLKDLFKDQIEKDIICLEKAFDAFETANHYHFQASQKIAPDANTINRANAMRVIQLGESMKNLVDKNILEKKGIINQAPENSEWKDLNVYAICRMRDHYSHPEGHTSQPSYDFSSILFELPPKI